MDLINIIESCKAQDRKAQKQLYDLYAPRFMSICMRYMKRKEDAEDALLESFYSIFKKIEQYKSEGSFEGWMKRVLINQCLMMLRKKTNFHMSLDAEDVDRPIESTSAQEKLQYDELLRLLQLLPNGYRTVFNLYVIEGYKHREIAEQLGISINTSKSQLILAKKKLQSLLKKKAISKYA